MLPSPAPEDTAISLPPLALVPLDDRPCNRLFPAQLAEIAGLELVLPPREMLGWFTTPGNCDGLAAWLQEVQAQHVVISLDMLCYGGLVAARAEETEASTASARLEGLRGLKRQRPDLTILASSVLPRLGMTVASAGALSEHQDLIAYATLRDRVARLGEEEARAELEAVSARLGEELIERYLEVRRRNQELSQAALQLAAEGVLDYLALVQEDAAPVGLHLGEQEALRAATAQLGVEDKVALHPGADEIGLVLLARHCAVTSGLTPRLCADYAGEAGSKVIPRYEDRPLRETVESTLRAAGAELAAPMGSDAMLFVHTPVGEQRESAEAPPAGQAPALAMQSESIAERVGFAAEAGRVVGLADVAYANGGDPELLGALERTGAGKGLRAYAGWNTASNTVGTAVAQLCLEVIAGATREASAASRQFLACRLADDFEYQTCVRPLAMARAAALGADQFALGEHAPRLEEHVRRELTPRAEARYAGVTGRSWQELGAAWKVSLPWGRLFEVEVEFASAP
jgi:hypothetical protein